ncbi:SIR2 family protein [Coralloluteibacterium thermophilus]|uniref:SIR2 family protein n=1 Tax=Coralloluteibacterium thermophilum TaxID=2707049 RepID=A0ABV9NI60_9GAMM
MAVPQPDAALGGDAIEQLVQAYRSRSLMLFVGAGVSMSLGLPSWHELVDHMAEELGFDPEEFRGYGSELTLAEFYRIAKGQIGPLRSWMDREWHSGAYDIANSRIHALIARAEFDLIYTTNYDRWIEKAFEHHGKPYLKITGVGDLSAVCGDSTQIVKFHGDFDDDTSLVLDESSFFERLEFESPLDIKLRADVLGRSVLFIGYSLSDINIRYLFFKLSKLWRQAPHGVPQPVSFIFSTRPNPVQEAALAQWNIRMIAADGDDPAESLERLMTRLVEATPARPRAAAAAGKA